jgi:ribosomal-protein-alanine N-acetyltransferase
VTEPLLPPLGLLLSRAFDRAVVVTLRQWPWFIACIVAHIALQYLSDPWKLSLSYPVEFVWITAALIGALRLSRPDFKVTIGLLLRLVGVYIIYETVVTLGLVLLVIPGFYFGAKLWLVLPVVALEDKSIGQAIARSWELTSRAFWPTLVILVSLTCVVVVPITLAYIALKQVPSVRLVGFNQSVLQTTVHALQGGIVFYIDAAAIVTKLLWMPVLAALPKSSNHANGNATPNPDGDRQRLGLNREEGSLETARLFLEPIKPWHAFVLYESLRDPQLYRFVSQAPPESEQALRQRFESLASGLSQDGSQLWLNWAVLRKDGQYVGLVQSTVEGDQAVIGYDIFTEYWRNGYGKEACGAMIDTVLRGLRVKQVRAIVDADNAASIALLEGLGFTRAWTGPSDDMPGHTDHRYEFALV